MEDHAKNTLQDAPAANIPATTPKDSILASVNNSEIQIDTDALDIVLDSTINHFFTLDNFSNFGNNKEILEYFFNREYECRKVLKANFSKQKLLYKFYKNLIYDLIKAKYLNIKEISKYRNSIQTKLDEITKEIDKNKKYKKDKLSDLYNKYFKTTKIPKFLNGTHRKKIKFNEYLTNFDQKYQEIFLKDELIKLNEVYYKFIRKEINPFEFCMGPENFYNIFLISNANEINKSSVIKRIFLENSENIIKAFCLDVNTTKPEFDNFIIKTNNINFNIDLEIQRPMDAFNQMVNPDRIYYSLASYFYLVFNILKDSNNQSLPLTFTNKDLKIKNETINVNINNPYMNKILTNLTNTLAKYSVNAKFNYPSLINSFTAFIINGCQQTEFKCYNITEIEQVINNSKVEGINKEKLYNLKEKLNAVENGDSIPGILLNKLFGYLSNNNGTESNKISFFPLNKRIYSNTITIFLSGFLSENDDLADSWRNFIGYDSRFSNYFFYRWPSYSFLDIFFKGIFQWSDIINNIIYLPKMFKNGKLKAKYSGKILGKFLASNKIFNNFQINLVGFSLGCHVLKNCLKELNEIKGKKILINNVIFMGGATTLNSNKWPIIFKNVVGGRIINCFSTEDEVLNKLFKLSTINNGIGSNSIVIKDDERSFNYVENYDFSDLNLGHLDYRDKFEEILKRIEFN